MDPEWFPHYSAVYGKFCNNVHVLPSGNSVKIQKVCTVHVHDDHTQPVATYFPLLSKMLYACETTTDSRDLSTSSSFMVCECGSNNCTLMVNVVAFHKMPQFRTMYA